MYDTSDLRKGLKVLIDKQPYIVVTSQFVKPGKGQAFTRTKLKNLITGSTLDRTFKSGEKLEPADLEERQMQYLYVEGDKRVFMDTTNYEQVAIPDENVGETKFYLMDSMMVDVLFFEGRALAVTPPTFVELKVVETEPGFKGDTATGATKPAKLETGLTVSVPLFVESGEKLKIDTRTGEYVERVK